MSNFILSSQSLCKTYEKSLALNSVTINLSKGKIIGLLGPNGSGKTTLIKIAAGLLKPTKGSLQIDGQDIGVETKKIVSYLPERNSLPLTMNAEELMNYFQDFFPDFNENRCRKMLTDLAIPLDKPIKTFSKGMKEKIQLVLVMSRDAKLFLLDEPIAGVDPATREYIMKVIFEEKAPESTILISTHLIQDIEPILDEFIFIKNGVIMQYNSTENVRNDGKTLNELFLEVFKWEC